MLNHVSGTVTWCKTGLDEQIEVEITPKTAEVQHIDHVSDVLVGSIVCDKFHCVLVLLDRLRHYRFM